MNGIADYDFVTELGKGSHGTVWQASCPDRLGLGLEHVAVKTLAHNAADGDLDRLADEFRLYRSVSSPYLLQIYDVGQQGATLYYAMEYVADGSLAQPARPFTRAAVLSALAAAGRAAHALHEGGQAHRGIKPGNVLLRDEAGCLSDIGLAHLLNPGQTITGVDQVGSIEFLAPEVIQGHAATRATDIWALGATMHRVLTGRGIYPDLPTGSLLQALRFLLSERPTLNDSMRPDELTIVERALAADPVDRHYTAKEFADDVEQLADRLLEAERA